MVFFVHNERNDNMATDFTNEKIPGDDFNAPDINFQNDTSNAGSDNPELNYVAPTEGELQLKAVDDEIKQAYYRDPNPDEFVIGRNQDAGWVGINSSDLNIIVGHVTLPLAPTITELTQNASGMYGQRWLGNNYGAKVFNIPVTIIAKDADEYLKNTELLSKALIQMGNTEAPIVFGQFPDRTFYGHFTSIPEPAYIGQGSWDATLTLQFTASDPHGYLKQVIGSADNTNKLSIMPDGNDIAKPTYQFTFTSDSNNFGYTNSKGDNVFVGFPDDSNTQDLTPVVYRDPIEDIGTFTQITDMSTQNWALSNADVTLDAAVKMLGKHAITVDKFWGTPKDYTGQATAYGPALLTKRFNVGSTGDWRVSTRISHQQFYPRAYQRTEFYLLDKDGNRIGRAGLYDSGSSNNGVLKILFGKNTAEENANYSNGFGFIGPGNTKWALDQTKNIGGHEVTLQVNQYEPNLTVDRQVSTHFTQCLYDGHDSRFLPDAVKWQRDMLTVEKWKTPRDSSGKATGPQIYTKEVEQDRASHETVPNSSDIWKNSTQDYYKWTQVWDSAMGETLTWSRWHNVGTPNPGYGNGWSWRSTSYDRGGNWDKGAGRVNQPGTITSTIKEFYYDAPNIITNLWANFELTKIGNQIHLLVNQIAGSGLESGNTVLDYTVTVPSGFNTQVAQIAYFFGKTPIHEDKITKTTPADNDKPASYEYVKPYQDDRLTVTDLTVQSITTAEALKKAHTIIHAGDTATIDTETENVYINGKVANKYLSPASTYPLLTGGQSESIQFFPTADKATVRYNYRPAMK